MKKYQFLFICSFLLFFAGKVFAVSSAEIDSGKDSDNGDINPEVYFVLKDESGTVELSVNYKNFNHPFFGSAFDIYYDNSILDYKSYSLGDIWQGKDPLNLLHQKDNRITVGISLKRGDLMPLAKEGNILKIKFLRRAIGKIYLRFENGILATFKGDEKIEIPNVAWPPYSGISLGEISVLNLNRMAIFKKEVLYLLFAVPVAFLLTISFLFFWKRRKKFGRKAE